jgi:hypothetical protein
MDLARSSAARTANRFRELPLFEPAAERCALTWRLSMESSWTGGRRAGFATVLDPAGNLPEDCNQ